MYVAWNIKNIPVDGQHHTGVEASCLTQDHSRGDIPFWQIHKAELNSSTICTLAWCLKVSNRRLLHVCKDIVVQYRRLRTTYVLCKYLAFACLSHSPTGTFLDVSALVMSNNNNNNNNNKILFVQLCCSRDVE